MKDAIAFADARWLKFGHDAAMRLQPIFAG